MAFYHCSFCNILFRFFFPCLLVDNFVSNFMIVPLSQYFQTFKRSLYLVDKITFNKPSSRSPLPSPPLPTPSSSPTTTPTPLLPAPGASEPDINVFIKVFFNSNSVSECRWTQTVMTFTQVHCPMCNHTRLLEDCQNGVSHSYDDELAD